MSVVAPHTDRGGLRATWHELQRRRRRRSIAQGYEALLRDAHEPPARWVSARAPVLADQVLAAEPEIERLVGRLRGHRGVTDEGLQRAHALLIERGSPLYERAGPHTLRRRVVAILDAMG
jgi:hypothetical protein